MKNTSDLCQKPLNLRVLVFEHAQEKDIAKQCPLPKGKGLIFLDISLTTREFLYPVFNSQKIPNLTGISMHPNL